MKRLIKQRTPSAIFSSIIVEKRGNPRTRNSFKAEIDSFEDFRSLDQVESELKRLATPHAVDPSSNIYMSDFDCAISSQALNEGLDKWGDKFLKFLRRFNNESDFFSFIDANAYSFYDANITDSSRYYSLARQVESLIDALPLKGLSVKVTRYGYIYIDYKLDGARYDLESPQRISNWNKVVQFVESISCVYEVTHTFRYEGRQQAFANAYICNISGDEVTCGPVPEFESVPFKGNDVVMYKVTYTTQPDHFRDQRSKFHQSADGELYVVHTANFQCKNDSIESFLAEVYDDDMSEFTDWDSYLSWLSSKPYEGNGVLLSDEIVKIVRIQSGRSKTIFKRDLP